MLKIKIQILILKILILPITVIYAIFQAKFYNFAITLLFFQLK